MRQPGFAASAPPAAQQGPLLAVFATVLALVFLLWPGWEVPLGLLVAALALGALANPRFGLSLTVLTIFVATPYLFHASGLVSVWYFLCMAAAVLTLGGLFIRAAILREPLATPTPFSGVLGLMAVYYPVAVLWSPNFAFGAQNALVFLLNLVIFYVITRLTDSPERLRRLFLTILASAALASAGVVLSMYWEKDLVVHLTRHFGYGFTFFTQRPGGFENSNQVAGFLVFCAFCAAGLASSSQGRARTACWLLGALYFTLSITTASRGALIGCLAVILAYFFINPATRPFFLRRSLLLGAVTMLCVLAANPSFIDRMLVGFGYTGELFFTEAKSTARNVSETVTGTGARFDMWKDAFEVMREEPLKLLFGLGPGGFMYYTGKPEVHSAWLAFFFDMGIFGALAGMFLLFLMARRVKAALARGAPGPVRTLTIAALLGFCAEILVHGLIDYDLTSNVSRFVFFYLATLVACLNVLDPQGARGKA